MNPWRSKVDLPGREFEKERIRDHVLSWYWMEKKKNAAAE